MRCLAAEVDWHLLPLVDGASLASHTRRIGQGFHNWFGTLETGDYRKIKKIANVPKLIQASPT